MLNRRLDVLGLRTKPAVDADAEAVRPLVRRLLDMVADLLPAQGAQSPVDEHLERLASLRNELAEAVSVEQMVPVGDAVLTLFSEALERDQRERKNASAELTAIITIVRDTMASLAGEEAVYSAKVNNSTIRLEALQRVSDIQRLKALLLAEVHGLKALAAEREKQWRSKLATFEHRVHMLEEQLVQKTEEAAYDPLTGVCNRRGIEERFTELKTGTRLVLAVVDLDGFKAVNDTLGHLVGDQVLIATAGSLRESVRNDDVVGRLGGDEFVLLMSNVTLRPAEHRLRGVIDAVSVAATRAAGMTPENDPPISASCGVAELSAGDSLQSLLRRADDALYEAKRLGKGRVMAKEAPFLRDLQRR